MTRFEPVDPRLRLAIRKWAIGVRPALEQSLRYILAMLDGEIAPPAPPVYADDAMPYAAPPTATAAPGRILGIVGFVLSFFFLLDIGGLILCIIALVQARRAGRTNGLAVAGIVVSAVSIVVSAVVIILGVSALVDAAQTCARLGNGVHVVGSSTYTCTPTSFYVRTGG
jgi:hypothetical protein